MKYNYKIPTCKEIKDFLKKDLKKNWKVYYTVTVTALTILFLIISIQSFRVTKQTQKRNHFLQQENRVLHDSINILVYQLDRVNNITKYVSPPKLVKNHTSAKNSKIEYIKEYKEVSILAYLETYFETGKDILPSVSLAQGIHESNSGNSKLAKTSKNHFGIKCFSTKCSKGHCTNYNDDHHKDFFRCYKHPIDSYYAHSNFLLKPRYKKIFPKDKTDYKSQIFEIKEAGYATDKKYVTKVSKIVEDFNLDQFDDVVNFTDAEKRKIQQELKVLVAEQKTNGLQD